MCPLNNLDLQVGDPSLVAAHPTAKFQAACVGISPAKMYTDGQFRYTLLQRKEPFPPTSMHSKDQLLDTFSATALASDG